PELSTHCREARSYGTVIEQECRLPGFKISASPSRLRKRHGQRELLFVLALSVPQARRKAKRSVDFALRLFRFGVLGLGGVLRARLAPFRPTCKSGSGTVDRLVGIRQRFSRQAGGEAEERPQAIDLMRGLNDDGNSPAYLAAKRPDPSLVLVHMRHGITSMLFDAATLGWSAVPSRSAAYRRI